MRIKRPAGSERGIALFMVMAALALLTVLMTELTYSTQINSRLAYNFLDNLKAYYLVKAAYKLSQVRLKAYVQVLNFLEDPNNKPIKESLPKGTLQKIWSVPLMFPIPVPKEASMADTDAINDFVKKSSLAGSYTANIVGESSKLNLNNLLVKTVPAEGPSGGSGKTDATAPPPAAGASGASGSAVDFRPALVQAITSLVEQKKNEDREFADIYRNVQGEDIVTAIEYYLFPDKPASNLPGFKVFKPKLAPLYSLSELHLIPGIDDELYKLLESTLTVYSTPGININTINKRTLLALVPEMTDPEADDVMRKRDDPDVGQPWGNEEDFWKAVSETSAGRTLDEVKKRFKDAGIKIIANELSFKINVLANVGQSTRRLEAFVIIDPKAAKQAQLPQPNGQPPGQPAQPDNREAATGASGQQEASAKKPTGLNLVYWRML